MSLESHDSRTEAEHNDLDKALMKKIGQRWDLAFESPSLREIWTTLAHATCPTKSHDEYYDFFKDSREELTRLLNAAWKTKNFRAVRSLVFLNPAPAPKKILIHKASPEDETIKNAWDVEYVGDSHEVLLETLRAMNKSAHAKYSNILPIVQSSGMGKSRCVHEAARFVFTLPLNTRPVEESSGYPPSDSQVFTYFRDATRGMITEARAACCAFLKALFSSSIKFLESNLSTNFGTSQELALAWRGLLQDQRSELYADVCLEAKRLLAVGEIPQQSGEEVITLACDEGMRLRDVIRARVLSKVPTGEDIAIMLYVDEAHGLTSLVITEDPTRNMYTSFLSVAARLLGFDFVALTLSTNSSLSKLAPPMDVHHSARVVPKNTLFLQPPFTELGFDYYEGGRALFHPNTMSLKDVAEESFMIKFGRPLFWTRWEGSANVNWVRKDMINFAHTKLIGHGNILPTGASPEERERNGLLAAIGTRILLEFDTSREESRKREMQLVEGHMRIAYSVPIHRQYIRSGYPSEPILAEAAAHEMNSETQPIINVLSNSIDNGLIDKGNRGELVARLILTQAYDKAIQTSYPQPWKYSRGVTVVAFLTALISEKYIEDVLNCAPDGGRTPLKKAFKNAYIRFTHFAQNGKNKVDTDAALAGIVRGMAVQVEHNQRDIDIMIPITLGEDKLREEIMTGILIQVKDKATPAALSISAKKINFFPADCQVPRPYITIIMQLGLQTAIDIRQYRLPLSAQELSSPSRVMTKQGHQRTTRSTENSLHPRYQINIRGCSGTVYGVVDNKDVYAKVLATRNVIQEHPRNAPRNLAALRRLKPVWERNKQCFEWIRVPALQGELDGWEDEDLPMEDEGDICSRGS
ncbi:hypothetical protein PHLCEN_2v11764 [Hermanssonia centrifuga]|uniref:Uncharacterized protein n=1 Tax=Hermanssonia centrifuga TaxID=98765 RepID=A0A2R6NJE1_9APHY|nr:hypothetical protein PHLCEN_2v11764 [Hermanssonia centrifuga]